MPNLQTITDALLGPRADAWVARATVWTALIGFLAHLSLWALLASGFWSFGRENVLLQSPLLALYTPFSILLAYEVFQLIRVIPESFSASIGKQFEVITLIVARESLVYLAGLSAADFEAPPVDSLEEVGLLYPEGLAQTTASRRPLRHVR